MARLTLDPLDRRLLVALEIDPGASLARLAQDLQVSPRSVGRRLRRLQQVDAIRVSGRTLPTFGGRLARLYRAEADPPVLEKLGRQVAALPGSRAVRLAQNRGELMWGLVLPRGDAPDPLGGVLGGARLRALRAVDLLDVFARPGAVERPARELDATDHAILRAVAPDGRVGSSVLARRLGLDASTVARRRRRLMDEGVLYLEADVHPDALDLVGEAMVWITMAPGHVRAFARALRDRPEVRFVAATSGRTALVANVLVPDRSALVPFVDEHLAGPGVAHVEVVVLGPVLKRALGAMPR